MELKNSKTYNNLIKAFKGECEAHTKYELYSKKAKKEGYNIVADLFDEAAKNEFEHMKIFFKKANNDDVPITINNLMDCIKNENHENKELYREFANVAKQEGFNEIENIFNMIADIEGHHEELFTKALNQIKNSELFKGAVDDTIWICSNCGHVHKSKDAPDICPVCFHPQAYFYKEL